MFNNRQAFEDSVFASRPAYPDAALASVEVAWEVYRAAANTDHNMLLLGRWVGQADEANPGIDGLVQGNFHIMDEVFTGGAVMNSNRWTILVNDAWVLGGIHAHTPFYLASPRTLANLYQDDANRLTVTGRELVGLRAFGYQVNPSDLGEVAVCQNVDGGHQRALAADASFEAYAVAVQEMSVNNAWHALAV
ncbi:MAG: hypothetical protein AAGM22_16845 [Acidobacteriota bacterium]